ncbi:YciI family protein [uncultured Winogradskyella sp.]|uniref:YciI family protein n=1 Tax=uncultured Winogradskyella sp. TaxID=395353 RepID=UPI00262A10EF|nr:YciI family protein [uncultured Winogradskyella sp.]
MKKSILLFIIVLGFLSCKNDSNVETDLTENKTVKVESTNEVVKEQSTAELKAKLTSKGYQIFDYVDEKTQDTILMQQYFIAFLKRGSIRTQNEEEAAVLQKEHLAHLGKMYDLGYADISGPFGDDGDIRGITIYNVPTLEMADSLANSDPMVKAGRLAIEIHPWWAAKGFPLR